MTKTSKVLESGWSRVKFGDVVRVSKERCQDPLADGVERFIGLEHIDPEDLRIKRWGSVADGVTFTNVFKPGQVLFGKRRAYQRKVAVADFSGVCSGDIYVLESLDATILLPELLPFICQTEAFFDHAVGTSAGSLSPRTNWKSLAEFEFALPPMAEQQQVIEIASVHLNYLDSNRDLTDALNTLLLSHAEAAFCDNCQISDLQKIGDIGDVHYGLTINPKRRAIDRQMPYLRVANIQRFRIDLSEVKEVGVDDKDDRCTLMNGDILVVEGHADINELGRAAIWEGQLPICLHQNHLIRIRCHDGVDPHYILEYVNSPAGRAYFRGRGKSTSGLNTLNSTVVREMPIPIPTLEIQQAIAGELQEARRALQAVIVRKEQISTIARLMSNRMLGAT